MECRQSANIAILKAISFVWLSCLGKILTLNNLMKCRIIVIDWHSITSLWDYHDIVEWSLCYNGIILGNVKKGNRFLLTYWRDNQSNSEIASIWKMVLTCLWWCIWRDMNEKNFKDQEWLIDDIIYLFFKTLVSSSIVIDFHNTKLACSSVTLLYL